MAGILNGKFIEDEKEKSKLFEEILVKKNFGNLVKELKKHVNFEKDSLKTVLVYEYDALNLDNEIMTGKNVSLKSSMGNVFIDFIKINTDDKTHDLFTGEVITTDESNQEMRKGFMVDNKGNVSLIYSEKYDIEMAGVFRANVPNNSDYTPGESKDALKAQDFTEFCLTDDTRGIDYNHCGKNCGDDMKYGGGREINNLDGCCHQHDNCWKNFGSWDHCCDKNIVSCAKKYKNDDYATYLQITAFFGGSALLC
ncbi:hypothetical protein C2W64_01967 [Brevibacillus laterosporus]|nr:hypothetical protein [Brevibacillus laterosporus]RAP26424.1 hypothetical protein C2W64_01967 [Brevibacillus laterosporus]